MGQLKRRIRLLVMGSIILLATSLMVVFYFQFEPVIATGKELKAKADLGVIEAIIDLKYPGPWHVRDNELCKGQTSINNNFTIVDEIKQLTGNTCVIFHRNICVSTTVPEGECNRAIGIYAPYEITSKVLEAGQSYIGQATLAGECHQTAYKPIRNQYGEIIGVLYVGVPISGYDSLTFNALKWAVSEGALLVLLIGLGAQVLTSRALKKFNNDYASVKTAREHELITGRLETVAAALPEQQAETAKAPPTASEQTQGGDAAGESDWLDDLLNLQKKLPKGLNRVTLKQILLYLRQHEADEITIQEVSAAVSLSRVTVRHYFDYLHECGLVDMEQKYGSVGRPLRIYRSKI